MKQELNRTQTVSWAILVFMLGCIAMQPAYAQDNQKTCSLETLQGRYILDATGFNVVNGLVVPKTVVEFIDFHGDGTLASIGTAVVGGNKISDNAPGAGTYNVNSDCTGTLTFTSFPFPVFNLYSAPNGKQVHLIQTSPTGQMLAGPAHRVSN